MIFLDKLKMNEFKFKINQKFSGVQPKMSSAWLFCVSWLDEKVSVSGSVRAHMKWARSHHLTLLLLTTCNTNVVKLGNYKANILTNIQMCCTGWLQRLRLNYCSTCAFNVVTVRHQRSALLPHDIWCCFRCNRKENESKPGPLNEVKLPQMSISSSNELASIVH